MPSYDGTRWNGSALGSMYVSNIDTFEISTSLLTSAFNRCWVEALNKRPYITHFLLMHADVVPNEFDWFQQLWEEFEAHNCSVLSLAIPIKNEVGLTSIALESGDFWKPRRLTVSEILDLPMTWTRPDVLVNTGMLLVDFTQPWVEKVCFTINDRIYKNTEGKWVAEVESEDWNFSRQCRALGIPNHVTRRVGVRHMGMSGWNNVKRWGLPYDEKNATASLSDI